MPVESVEPNKPDIQIPHRKVSNDLDKNAFLKILVTQLQNQDPLNPIEDQDFIAQMAQFSVLEQIQSLNEGFSFSQATSLVGKNVYAEFNDEAGQLQRIFGPVTSALTISGQPYLEVNGYHVPYTANVIVYDYSELPALPPSDTDESEISADTESFDAIDSTMTAESTNQTDYTVG